MNTNPSLSHASVPYRHDIDGLRAIAVILVIFFHAGLSQFRSGFIGVDVFFVISGYLITSIILNDINQNRVSLIHFYQKRLWRLQPMVIFILFATLMLAFVYFLPKDLIRLSHSARKVVLFIVNHFFARTTTDYFATDNHNIPLLHLWSLAVEWHCYLTLPLLILLIHYLVPEQQIKWIFLSLIAITFFLSQNLVHHDATKSYFYFTNRIFEFLFGAFIASLSVYAYNSKYTRVMSDILGVCCLIGLIAISHKTQLLVGYPNYYSLLICICTAGLLFLGQYAPNHISARILSLKVFTFLGLLSYSLYLWHGVIFAFMHYEDMAINIKTLPLALLVIGILSFFSWHLVENRFRHVRNLGFKSSLVLLIAMPIGFIYLIDAFILRNHGYPKRFSSEFAQISQVLANHEDSNRKLCISKNTQTFNKRCIIGQKKAAKKHALMIGDSFANHFWKMMDVLGKDASVDIYAQSVSSCLMLPNIYMYDWWEYKHKVYDACHKQSNTFYGWIKNNHYDYVILGQIWHNYLNAHLLAHADSKENHFSTKKMIEISFIRALKIITQSGAKPIIIKNNAILPENLVSCFYNQFKKRKPYDSKLCSFIYKNSRGDVFFDDLFSKLQKQFPTLVIMDPKSIQCPHNKCRVDFNGIPIYRDVGHITDYASMIFGKSYLERGYNPLT